MNGLAKLDQATKMLAEVRTVDDAKNIMDMAAAAKHYAKKHGMGKEAVAYATEIEISAEIKLGEFLHAMDTNKGAAGGGKKESPRGRLIQPRDETPTLAELGISKDLSAEAKALADLSDEDKEKVKKGKTSKKAAKKKVKQKKINEARKVIAQKAETIPASDRYNIFNCDIETFKPQKQYDFIITDPPYPKEYLKLYETLAIKSKLWLKEGGLLVAMCGQSYFNEIVCMMVKHIEYYWIAAYLTPGQPTPLRQRQVNTTWKPLIILSNGQYTGKIFGDVFKSDLNEKDFHKWGQSVSGMQSIISGICLPGQTILDPFCGSGTTGIAAIKHGCLFDGIDIDIEYCKIAKTRISEYDTKKT